MADDKHDSEVFVVTTQSVFFFFMAFKGGIPPTNSNKFLDVFRVMSKFAIKGTVVPQNFFWSFFVL